jgi:hypothetical protein
MNGNQPPSIASENPSSASSSSSIEKIVGTSVSGKFTESEVKQYFSTMIEMANHFNAAKQIEKKTGRKIYRDTDIKIYTGGKNNYVDPVENTVWEISQIWFFPKYDALLFDVRVNNPSKNTSMWDFSQVRWQPNNSPKNFSSTAAAPLSMQTLPERTNQIWDLVQGNRLDPSAEFSPIFPRAERRGNQTVKNPEPEPSHKPKSKK